MAINFDYDGKIAILYNSEQKLAPSNPKAILKFIKAASKFNYDVKLIDQNYMCLLHEYDILFIRETTSLNDHTLEMSRIADNLDLVVIDDPESIEICCDKTKQLRLFTENNIPTPVTLIFNNHIPCPEIKFNPPYIVKNPYSCFSKGVFKVNNKIDLIRFSFMVHQKIDKIIIQEFIKTDFDWRIGLLDNKPLYACKYYMPEGEWKIIKHDKNGNFVEGKSEAISLQDVPEKVLEYAVQTSLCVGNGLYGVDIKQVSTNEIYVMEINDNPNIDAGNEDVLLGEELYEMIIRTLIHRHQEKVLNRP